LNLRGMDPDLRRDASRKTPGFCLNLKVKKTVPSG
jgi:hypothetical protein